MNADEEKLYARALRIYKVTNSLDQPVTRIMDELMAIQIEIRKEEKERLIDVLHKAKNGWLHSNLKDAAILADIFQEMISKN